MGTLPLGGEDPLEKGMATHFGILAGESHGQRSLASHGVTNSQTRLSDLFSSRSGRNVQLRKIRKSITTLSARKNKEMILNKSPSPRHRSRHSEFQALICHLGNILHLARV